MAFGVSLDGVPIQTLHGTLKLSRMLSNRSQSCSFSSKSAITEGQEISVENTGGDILFAGIIDKVNVTSKSAVLEYRATSTGYKKMFDRKRVVRSYLGQLAGDIVRDIIADFTEGFTDVNVEDGITIESVPFNYVQPSDAIQQIADAIGYTFFIDNDRDVHFVAAGTLIAAAESITDSSANFRDLEITPDLSNLRNVVFVRGGKELTSQQVYEKFGDNLTTFFPLPEKPKEVEVYVDTGSGYVLKTLGIKFGETVPTTEFLVNYQEKYIENGTHAVLGATHKIKVLYQYESPILVRRKNDASIAAMQALFPGTDGEFEHLIEDSTIDSSDLARRRAEAELDAYSNAVISGKFKMDGPTTVFDIGQVLTINAKGFSREVVIQKVSMDNLGGDLWRYTIEFATVLFKFEDFLRMLLTRGQIALNDGELVQHILDNSEELIFTDSWTLDKTGLQISEGLICTDSHYQEKNRTIQYVVGPYFPVSFADNKRVFILNASPLG